MTGANFRLWFISGIGHGMLDRFGTATRRRHLTAGYRPLVRIVSFGSSTIL